MAPQYTSPNLYCFVTRPSSTCAVVRGVEEKSCDQWYEYTLSDPAISSPMDSPFTSRLDSNYAATDSESLEIQTLLELPTSRLEELSTKLKELDEQYTQLSNEQSSLLLFISKHRALISLIRKLPIDILQEIFIACLPTAHNAVMSRREPPILLTQICSSWRHIAHATPQLWKSIHIAVPCDKSGRYSSEYPNSSSMPMEHIERRSEGVLEWLSRSATYPLDISLGTWGTGVLDGSYDKIFNSLIPFSERWRDVRFSAPFQALVPVASLPRSKVPLLESLSLNCPPTPPVHLAQLDPQSVWVTSGLLKAPKLRDLWLRGYWLAQLNEDVTRLPVNWSQLTNISLEGSAWGASPSSLSVSRAYKLLSLCQNLTTCRLEIVRGSPPLEPTAALITLPFLTRLTVREEGISISRLFTLLHLPFLDYIEFHTTIRPTPESSSSLLSLLSRFHNTTQLITDAQFFTRQDFIRCLRLCPLLKSLSIRRVYAMGAPPDIPSCRIDDAFLKLFTESSNDEGYLCPHLEDFESSSETAFSENALLQFVKGKNGGSKTGLAELKNLSVIFYSGPLCDVNQELEPYKQAGLVATIIYPLTAPFSAFGGLPGYLPPY